MKGGKGTGSLFHGLAQDPPTAEERQGHRRRPMEVVNGMKRLAVIVLSLATLAAIGEKSLPARAAEEIPFIDAHSQVAAGLDMNEIIPLMDKAGVRRVILSARNDRSPEEIAEFAATHPGRITAAVRTKGNAFNRNTPGFDALLKAQLGRREFSAMAEVILWHARKGNKAPEMIIPLDSPQAQKALSLALQRGWPFIAHIEFAAAGWYRDAFMEKFEATARSHPGHPFALIHMGQLDPGEAGRLIQAHPNVYFLTSHSNPINKAESNQPWTNLFSGERLAPDWKALFIKHRDRFVLAFDNVFAEHWGPFFLEQAALWRGALADLPAEVAHAVAHGNAERLWKLQPIK